MRICRYSMVDFLVFFLIMVCSLVVFHWVRILCLYLGPLKQLCVALHSLLKGTLRGLLLRLVQQWLSARPRSMVKQAWLNSCLGILAFQQRSVKMVSLKLKLLFLLLYLDLLVQSLARLASSLPQVFAWVGCGSVACRSVTCGSIACGFEVCGSVACGYMVCGYMVCGYIGCGSGVAFGEGPIGVSLGNRVVV